MSEILTQEQESIVQIITIIGSVFSISAAMFVIILFWFFKENRTFQLELVVWYSISNTLFSISALLPYKSDVEIWCPLQSFLMTTFLYSNMCWTCIIGYSCFMSVIKKNHIEHHKKMYRIGFVLMSLLIPAGLSSM